MIEPIKKEAKKKMSKAFVEAPLEMLYYSDDINDIVEGNKDMWKWKTIWLISLCKVISIIWLLKKDCVVFKITKAEN